MSTLLPLAPSLVRGGRKRLHGRLTGKRSKCNHKNPIGQASAPLTDTNLPRGGMRKAATVGQGSTALPWKEAGRRHERPAGSAEKSGPDAEKSASTLKKSASTADESGLGAGFRKKHRHRNWNEARLDMDVKKASANLSAEKRADTALMAGNRRSSGVRSCIQDQSAGRCR